MADATETLQAPFHNAVEQITETFRSQLDLNKRLPENSGQFKEGIQTESDRSRTLGDPFEATLSKGRRKKPVNRPVAQDGQIPTRIQKNVQNPRFVRSSMNKLTELLEAKLDLSDFTPDTRHAGEGSRIWQTGTTRSGVSYKKQSDPSNCPTQPSQPSRPKTPKQSRKPSTYLTDQEFIARFGYRPSSKIINQMRRLEKQKAAMGHASFATLSMNNKMTMPDQELNRYEKARRQALFLLQRWERNPDDPLQGFDRGNPGSGADAWFKPKHEAMVEGVMKAGEISDDGTIEGDAMEE